MSKLCDSISGLFPKSQAHVIGIPPDFNIVQELENADSVRIAIAFCHMTGWLKILPGIQKCKGTIHLITGLDFCQTEPALLRAWNRLAVSNHFCPRLMMSEGGIFHPKVLIVSNHSHRFSLVGSGNLSEGGLRTNIECFVHTTDESHIEQLGRWCDEIFQRAQEFGEDDIREYEVNYKKIRHAVSKIQNSKKRLSNPSRIVRLRS